MNGPLKLARREKVLVGVLVSGFGLTFLVACVSLGWVSLAADEAWILYGIQNLAERGVYAHTHGPGTTTTGGLFTVAELFLFLIAGNSVPLLRLFPLVCFLLLLVQITLWAQKAGFSFPAILLSGSVIIAIPGTLMQASSAYGTVPAMFLILWGLRYWDPMAEQESWKRRAIAAVLFGLAAATRLQFVFVFPALFAEVIVRKRKIRQTASPLGLTVLLGLSVFAVCHVGLTALSKGSRAVWVTTSSAGWDQEINLPFVLKKFLLAQSFLPLTLLLAGTMLVIWQGRIGFFGSHRLRVLAWFGWLVWIAWIVLSPREHLRYLWPSLAAFGCLLGFGLGSLFELGRTREMSLVRVGALLLGISCLAAGCITTTRDTLLGDLNLVTWERRGIVPTHPLARHGRFRPARDQKKMAAFLRTYAVSENIASLDYPVEIEFLSERRLYPLRWYARKPQQRGEKLPALILATPHMGRRMHLSTEGMRWIKKNCEVVVRFGDHVLYRVTGRYPPNPSILAFRWQPEGLP